jgi:DNA-3-methyladenine glycosylase
MARRRGLDAALVRLTNGPAKLAEALGITLAANGMDLTRGRLTIRGAPAGPADVATGPRIGITRAADLPLRFWLRGSPYVSRVR